MDETTELGVLDEEISDLEGFAACVRYRRARLAGEPEPTIPHHDVMMELFGTSDPEQLRTRASELGA